MKYLKFTYVDAVTGISVLDAPAANGPKFPAVDGLEFVWVRSTQYPTSIPEFFGTCPDTSFALVVGVIDVLTQGDFNAMHTAEMELRSQRLQSAIVAATQKRLDDFAATRNYDGILSACTYAASVVPQFAAEGQCCMAARDSTWAALYTVMAEVQAGTRPMPTSFADVEPNLPVLAWPA